MGTSKMNFKSPIWWATGSFALLLGLWGLLSGLDVVEDIFLPSPVTVGGTMLRLLGTEQYWTHIGMSCFRVVSGFLLAVAIAVPLGILAGASRRGSSVIEPPMEFIRYMPAVAFIPLVMIWAGIGEWAKVIIIFIGCFFQLVLMVADITRRVNPDWIDAARTMGATRWQVMESVIFPSIRPELMDTLRLMLGWAWTYLVVAELVAVNSGLGYSIMKAQRFMNTDQIFVGMIVIGLLGLISDRAFAYCNKRFFPWAQKSSK